MARVIFFIAIMVAAGYYILKVSMDVDEDSSYYSSDKTIEMINNLEAPAAGRKDQNVLLTEIQSPPRH